MISILKNPLTCRMVITLNLDSVIYAILNALHVLVDYLINAEAVVQANT
jgi:hypothetical protein